MSSALEDETASINAIYGPSTFMLSTSPNTYILTPPSSKIAFRLLFPEIYPDVPPSIQGPETSGGVETRKGDATEAVVMARAVLDRVFHPGEPCVYDLVEELSQIFPSVLPEGEYQQQNDPEQAPMPSQQESSTVTPDHRFPPPKWTEAASVTVKKSLFQARAAAASSPEEARAHIVHLLAHDKRVTKATHNMTAWRICGDNSDVVYQDHDDDGETAAGARLAHLLQAMGAWGVVVVVSRWFGGVLLGPERFKIICGVAREAVLEGGFAIDGNTARKGNKK